LKNHPIAEGSSNVLLPIRANVRVLLDRPQNLITGGKLHGKFRSADFRWSPTIHKITNVWLNPGQVPLYQVDNSIKVAYTKNQLQEVPVTKEMIKQKAEEKKKETIQKIQEETKSIKEPEKESNEEPKEEPKKEDEFINKRVSILFTDPKEWFDGEIVDKIKGGFYLVKFDDGEEGKYRLLPKSKGKS
jgi:hypothetical protein